MGLSAAERQRHYREKQWAKLANGPKVQCACGCGEWIPAVNKMGKPARYKHIAASVHSLSLAHPLAGAETASSGG